MLQKYLSMEPVRVTSLIKSIQFDVNNHKLIFTISERFPRIIQNLHREGLWAYNGIIMEGLLRYCNRSPRTFSVSHIDDSILMDLKRMIVNDFCSKNYNIPSLSYMEDVYDNDLENIIMTIKHTRTFKYFDNENLAAIYAYLHLIEHLEKNNEEINKVSVIEYMNELLPNIIDVLDYLGDVHKKISDDGPIEYAIEINTTGFGMNIIGEADIATPHWLYDVKCCRETFEKYDEWHRQLEVYNSCLRRDNIAILDVLTNHFIIFSSKDDFEKVRSQEP